MRLSGQYWPCLFFLRKKFERTKTQIKPKPTNKTKLNEQKTTKATIFCAEKLLRGGKLFLLHFLKKNWHCPDNLIYYTIELFSFDFAVIKILLPIYQFSQVSMAWSSRQATTNTWDFKNCRFKTSERLVPWLWNPYLERGLRHINRTHHYIPFGER